uniref:Uncharacterized protein n=1 Tax=Chlamydomonas leiostraca TaxID=1034604 RepID=A0A7S0WKB5_9CHLO
MQLYCEEHSLQRAVTSYGVWTGVAASTQPVVWPQRPGICTGLNRCEHVHHTSNHVSTQPSSRGAWVILRGPAVRSPASPPHTQPMTACWLLCCLYVYELGAMMRGRAASHASRGSR